MGPFHIVLRSLKVSLLIVILIGLNNTADAQAPWDPIAPTELTEDLRSSRSLQPLAAALFRLRLDDFRKQLSNAPLRDPSLTVQPGVRILLPEPSGRMLPFEVLREQTMAPELEEKFPSVRSFIGTGITDPSLRLRLETGPKGVTAMVFASGDSTYLIDPYSPLSSTIYQVYYRKDVIPDPKKPFQCLTDGTVYGQKSPSAQGRTTAGTCGTLRTYRTAIAASAEYTAYHSLSTDSDADKKTKALAAINTAVNRLNQIFESEFSIRLQLVANNNLIIYTDAATDPFNGNANSDITTNNSNTNTVIGSANYDWGHLFGAASLSGLAATPSVCSSSKAAAVTGVNAPTGDPFVVDYVAHEMGHQMGANHTQYNNCNREASTAMEPGSASTIMGYAGICSPNVQSNSDAYFHAVSIGEIVTYMHSGSGDGCATPSSSGNTAPVIASPQADRTIPKSTPFSLSITATDANSDALTYCWEQMDAFTGTAQTMPPGAANTSGPLFRSLTPVSTGTRWFPALATVNAGNSSSTWEVLPSVSRTLNFRGTARDARSGGGCTTEDNVVVTIDGNTGPFVVTAPNTSVTWTTTYQQKVKWSVAGTDLAPVSCSQVDILLSTDGGTTYPVTLASAVPNTGSANITVPANPGSQCRVKVQGNGNIFYDVGNANFTIQTVSVQDYQVWASTDSKTVCGASSTSYSIEILSILGFSGNVSLSASGLPAGVTAGFGSTTVATGGSTTLTLSNLSGLAIGTYSFSVDGSGTPGSRSLTLELVVSSSSLPVTLSSPADYAAGISYVNPSFSWAAVSGAYSYDLQVATDAAFTTLVVNQSGLSTNSYAHSGNLAASTAHWWRVRANSSCLSGAYTTRKLTTAPTAQSFTYNSSDVTKTISAVGSGTYTSTLTIPATGTLLDVDVVSLGVTHTYIEDLVFKLKHPDNTQITFFDVSTHCEGQDNINMGFDDESANSNASIPCPPTNGSSYVPDQALSAFDNKASNGTWTLTVDDIYNGDGGSLNTWGLRITLLPTYKWAGTSSTDWNTASNWTPASVPPTNADIEVPGSLTNYPVLDQDRTIGNLTLSSGARISLNGKTLSIIGTVSGTGTFRGSSSSSLALSGISGTLYLDQTTTGTTNLLKDLTLSGSATTTLGNIMIITGGATPGTLTLDGSTTLASAGYLTLQSDASGTARVATSTGTITGNVIVQRYIPAKASRKWVFLASPVAQPSGQYIRDAWQQQVFITGSGTGGSTCGSTSGNGAVSTDRYNSNGFDVSPTSTPSLFTYAASPVSGSRWTGVSNTNATALQRGTGYRINIRGSRGASDANCANQLNSASPATPAAVTLSVTGTIAIGDVSVSLNNYATHRYSLIGNPYPSSIDFSSFRSSNSARITDKFWSYSPTLSANTYSHYNAGSMTNKATGWDDASSVRIASGQAFFVEGESGQTSVTFSESHKTGSSIPNTNYFRTAPDWKEQVMVGLRDADQSHIDETLIRFADGYGDAGNITPYDGVSFNSGAFIAARKGASRLAIQTRPLNFDFDTVRLTLYATAPGTYSLVFSEHARLCDTRTVFLRDRFTGTLTRIDMDSTYPFQINSDTSSQGDHRFELILRRTGRNTLQFLGLDAIRNSRDVQLRWKVSAEDDVRAYRVQRSANGKDFVDIGTQPALAQSAYAALDAQAPAGSLWYRITTVEGSAGSPRRSATVRVRSDETGGTLNIHPNPAGSTLNVFLANAPDGTYQLRILDMQGRTMLQRPGIRFSGTSIPIDTGRLPSGNYIIELQGPDGLRRTENFIRK
jgi:subtilisin-like proprotein convertase family protein